MKKIDERHGGPYDRGSADCYYGRDMLPHYFEAETGMSPIVEQLHMSKGDIAAYMQGYSDQFESGVRKYV